MEATGGRAASLALALAPLLLGGACIRMGPGGSETPLMKATDSETTTSEYRAAANNLAVRIPGLIELTGDRMLEQTSDPELERRALLWKIEGTAAFQQALFRPDPLAAGTETWTLAIQIQEAVDDGALRDTFGPLQPVALEGARAIQQTIDDELRAVIRQPERYAELRVFVTRWAHENPIAFPFSARPSIQPLLAQMAAETELGAIEAFGSVGATVTDLSAKLDVYAASVPRSARWQAELAALDAGRTDSGRLAFATLESAHGVLERADTLLASELLTPAGMTRFSDATLLALREERIALLSDIERQRIDAFERLWNERRAVLDAVDAQRLATLIDLDAKIARGLAESEAVANRILLRAGVAIATLMALGALLAWLLARAGVLRATGPRP